MNRSELSCSFIPHLRQGLRSHAPPPPHTAASPGSCSLSALLLATQRGPTALPARSRPGPRLHRVTPHYSTYSAIRGWEFWQKSCACCPGSLLARQALNHQACMSRQSCTSVLDCIPLKVWGIMETAHEARPPQRTCHRLQGINERCFYAIHRLKCYHLHTMKALVNARQMTSL